MRNNSFIVYIIKNYNKIEISIETLFLNKIGDFCLATLEYLRKVIYFFASTIVPFQVSFKVIFSESPVRARLVGKLSRSPRLLDSEWNSTVTISLFV